MGAIDESKLNNILPKYDELKLSGKNLAQQYVSAFNTGMNIYQCINQLQGYIEWVIKAVNDIVIQWNEIIEKNLENTMQYVKDQLPSLIDVRIEIALNQLQDRYDITLEKLDKEQKAQATQILNINNEITSLKELCSTMQSSIQNNLEQINAINKEITSVKDDIINIKKGATPVASEGGI